MANINFSYADGTTLQQIIAFEVAAKLWESHLRDDVTVNLYAELTDQLDPDVMGGALPGFVAQQDYVDIKAGLSADATTSDDTVAVANLPTEDKGRFKVFAHGDKDVKTEKLNLTTANAKALGLIDAHGTQLDGYIAISDLSAKPNYGWNYDVAHTDIIGNNDLDFLSVVLHEVGHSLGFTSGLDDPGWLNTIQNSDYDTKKQTLKIKDSESNIGNPLDLFRYSDEALNQGKGDGQDWSLAGDDPYFSIDGGSTRIADLSSGEHDIDYAHNGVGIDATGDDFQASHWQHNPYDPVGIFDGAITSGVRRELSEVDLQALDIIGWDYAIDFRVETNSAASGGEVASLKGLVREETGAATFEFTGTAGTYDVVLGYFDETDGVSHLRVTQGGTLLDAWDADSTSGSVAPSASSFTTRTVANDLQINPGETFTLTVTENEGEFGRIDYLEFVSDDPAQTLRIEAESVASATYTTPVFRPEPNDDASEGQLVSLLGGADGETASLHFEFADTAGRYNVVLGYFDEIDGVSHFEVNQGSSLLDAWDADGTSGSVNPDIQSFTTRTVATELLINPGETFTVTATEAGTEYARLDYLEFQSIDSPGTTIRIEAEDAMAPGASMFERAYTEVVADLATQLGLTVAEIEANASNTYGALTGDQFDDVFTLLEDSEIYGDGWGSGGSSGGCGWCQDFADLFHQRAFFAELPTSSTGNNDPLTTGGNGVAVAAADESAATAATATTGGISGILYAQFGSGESQQAGQGAIAAATQALQDTAPSLNTAGSTPLNSDAQSLNLAATLTEKTDGYDVTQLMLKEGVAIMEALV